MNIDPIENQKIEQIDNVVKEAKKKKLKRNVIIVIVLALLGCCLIFVGGVAFAWYGGHIQKNLCKTVEVDSAIWDSLECKKEKDDDTDIVLVPTITDIPKITEVPTTTTTISQKQYDRFSMALPSGKKIEITKSFDPDAEWDKFKKDFERNGIVRLHNNPNNYGSDGQYFYYFPTENSMTEYFAGERQIKYPLESEILKDKTQIYYIYKEEVKDAGTAVGAFYTWEPKIIINKYKASTITTYYNRLENNSALGFGDNSALMSKVCIIDLFQFDKTEPGYLVFDGYASAGSEINYCELLSDYEQFEIKLVK